MGRKKMLMQNNSQNKIFMVAISFPACTYLCEIPNYVMLWGYFIEERKELSIPKCDCALHVMADYCFSIVVDKWQGQKPATQAHHMTNISIASLELILLHAKG
jgi:hypothetical protein